MRRPLLGILGTVSALVVVAVVALAVNVIWFRPFSLNLLYEKVFVEFMLDQPELLSQLGIAEQFGYRRHNAHLDDVSDAKALRDFSAWHRDLDQLNAYDFASQTPSQQLSTQVLAWYIGNVLDGERFRLHDYPVNQLFGVQNATPDFLINQHRIDDVRGAEDYLSRLGEFRRKFGQVVDGLALRERHGVVPPRFVIERVLAETRAFAGQPVADNPLYVNFAAKVGKLAGPSDADKQALLARCRQAIADSVVPAYQQLIAFLDGQLPRATTDDGVWKLPDGNAYYAYLVRSQTTTRLTPQQVHEVGLTEVARIEAEMRELLVAHDELQPGETPGAAMRRLSSDPRFLYPNTDAGRAAAMADYTRMLKDQLARSRTVIGLVPKAPIEVRRVPPFKEKTAPGAYYVPPALDGSRPGVFYANLRDMGENPTFGMRTLSSHEGVPGHHLQIALAQEQRGGPTFRKVLPFTAYVEGWALYAEWLGTELGLYKDDPYGDLGRLRDEMFRAVRLVVDTGIHARHWPRRKAIDYMVDKTGMAEPAVVSEVERYIVMPGQALAYKVGMMSIQGARRRAQDALGTRWDAEAEKAFHDVVLGGGALPLEILDARVDAWIRSQVPRRDDPPPVPGREATGR